MKIEDEEWLQRFQAGDEPNARPGAWLDVVMEISQPRSKDQMATFVVRKVNHTLAPESQAGLFGEPEV